MGPGRPTMHNGCARHYLPQLNTNWPLATRESIECGWHANLHETVPRVTRGVDLYVPVTISYFNFHRPWSSGALLADAEALKDSVQPVLGRHRPDQLTPVPYTPLTLPPKRQVETPMLSLSLIIKKSNKETHYNNAFNLSLSLRTFFSYAFHKLDKIKIRNWFLNKIFQKI